LAEYYYTVAALPHISFESAPAITEESFLSLCKDTLSTKDWEILQKTRLHRSSAKKTGSMTLDSWFARERSLRAEVAKLRAGKKGLETESYNQYGIISQSISDAARNAFNEASPAEAETILLRTLWGLLDELEAGHFFDLDKLIVYYLRLQIAELKQRRNKTEGEKNFSLLYDLIVQKNPS
jgi:hypothetical protein